MLTNQQLQLTHSSLRFNDNLSQIRFRLLGGDIEGLKDQTMLQIWVLVGTAMNKVSNGSGLFVVHY